MEEGEGIRAADAVGSSDLEVEEEWDQDKLVSD